VTQVQIREQHTHGKRPKCHPFKLNYFIKITFMMDIDGSLQQENEDGGENNHMKEECEILMV
jgi:hypothetical protein